MNDHREWDMEAPEEGDPAEVYCRRLRRKLPKAEHMDCAYCFGNESALAEGKRERFCDYDPKKDPKHFGFPEDTTRHTDG